MPDEDYIQIKVGNGAVGILGLKAVLEEMADLYADAPDEEVALELLRRIGKRNYIPAAVRDHYAVSFLREFKRYMGKEVDEGSREGLEVVILGPGCAQCDRLEQEIMAAMSELSLAGSVDHIRDIKKIAEYGILGTPALLINGKVKCVGRVPPRARLVEWLRAAHDEFK